MRKIHLLSATVLLLAVATVCPAQVTFTEYQIPTSFSQPRGITSGPDGNLWFTERLGIKIGRITTAGNITEYPIPTGDSYPNSITSGPDGNLWFTERIGRKIGKITTAGVITEFPVPSVRSCTLTSCPAGGLYWITVGPDGNLWFTEEFGDKIGRITPAGVITEFPLSLGSDPVGITSGPDGNIWFTEQTTNGIEKIGRITPDGNITEFPLPHSGSLLYGITAGPDGNLWFPEYTGNKIGRITPTGVITEFPVPTAGSGPFQITAGPDGNLWFTENAANKIGRITTSGEITEFFVSAGDGVPEGITVGPDGNLWITDGNKIVKATIPSAALSILPTTGGNAGSVTVQIFGGGFQAGVTAKLTGPGADLVGTNTTVSNGSIIRTTFDLTGAATGLWTVVITNSDNTSASLPGAFTVEEGGAPQIWLDIIGREQIRIGREQTYYIVTGNRGRIDSAPSVVSVVLPSAVTSEVDPSQPLIGKLTSGANNVLVFGLGPVPAGGISVIPISLQAAGAIANASTSTANVSALTTPGSFQLSAFLNLLMDLPAATGADFEANLPCQEPKFYATCDSQCAAEYLLQLQRYDLAKSQFEVYVNSSAAATAKLAELGSRRIAYAALSADVGLGVTRFVETIGLASAGGRLGVAMEQFISLSLQFIIQSTVATYSGDSAAAAESYRQASLQMSRAATNSATILQLVQNDVFAPVAARNLARFFNTSVGILANILANMGRDSDEYFALKLSRENALTAFGASATNFCNARNAVEMCHNQPGSPRTPCGSPEIPSPPSNPSDDRAIITITPVQSLDPNEKVGPQGVSSGGYISAPKALTYSIYFENQPTATAPAQTVTIADALNPTVIDPTLLTLGPISFIDKVVTPPSIPLAMLGTFSTDVDLRPTNDLIVRVGARIDTSTGIIKWNFTSLDPTTGQPPTDPLAGFLAPGQGGAVAFVIPPKNPMTGTQITNRASIVFDVNAPIETPVWLNTIDDTSPTSNVNALPATEPSTSFTVSWKGSDNDSGVQDFSVYVSDNGGAFSPWLANTPATSATFNGQSSHSYSFYSVARDLVGNIEPGKAVAEATTKVVVISDSTPPVISGMPAPGFTLWPANHKLVQVATVTATDAQSGVAPGSFKVTGSSNEPSDPKDPDIVITPNGSGGFVVQLRAERLGKGKDRIYILTATAADLAGNVATATATCTVPHDQGK